MTPFVMDGLLFWPKFVKPLYFFMSLHTELCKDIQISWAFSHFTLLQLQIAMHFIGILWHVNTNYTLLGGGETYVHNK